MFAVDSNGIYVAEASPNALPHIITSGSPYSGGALRRATLDVTNVTVWTRLAPRRELVELAFAGPVRTSPDVWHLIFVQPGLPARALRSILPAAHSRGFIAERPQPIVLLGRLEIDYCIVPWIGEPLQQMECLAALVRFARTGE